MGNVCESLTLQEQDNIAQIKNNLFNVDFQIQSSEKILQQIITNLDSLKGNVQDIDKTFSVIKAEEIDYEFQQMGFNMLMTTAIVIP